MTVSVIIPNYNHSAYLRKRIESVLQQTYKDFDLLILDDNSTDDSRKIIEEYVTKYPEIKTCFNETNSGNPFNQWNMGVDLSKGEYIWIAESDDFTKSDFLERTVAILKNYPDAGLVFTDSRIINEQKGTEYLASDRRAAFSNHKLEQLFNNGCDKRKSMNIFFENPIVNVSSVLFRKTTYLEAGGADTSMRFCGDWLIYFNIFLISEIRYIPEPLNVFRLHSDSSYKFHHRSNIFLKEKVKIFSFIIKNSRFSAVIAFLFLKKILKALILRVFFLLKINKILRIKIPYRPRFVYR